MRAVFYAIGLREPSARFRVKQYIPYLQNAGWRCTVWHTSLSYSSRLYAANFRGGRYLNARLVDLLAMFVTLPRILAARNFDLVFLQRRLPNLRSSPWLERILRRSSRSLVFDFDDAIYLNWSSAKGFHRDPRTQRSFHEIVKFSDRIIAGNTYLASMANSPFKTTVIPTPIDTDLFQPFPKQTSSTQSSLTIGWTGTAANYCFLYPLVPTLRKITKRFPHITLKIICNKPPDMRLFSGLQVQFVHWEAKNEVDQLQDIDIGIMYLTDNLWARGKCGFKLIQYMSLAKPVVASPFGNNPDIVKHGVNGYLALTMDDWYEYMSRLLEDSRLRAKLGYEARRTIKADFSVSVCFPKLLSVFQQALEREPFFQRSNSHL